MTKEEILQKQVSDFCSKWNTDSRDQILIESSLFFNDTLIVAFQRKCWGYLSANDYSMVYIFREDKEPNRIYYNEFCSYHPKREDWYGDLFLKTVISAVEKDGALTINFLTDDEESKSLTVKL